METQNINILTLNTAFICSFLAFLAPLAVNADEVNVVNYISVTAQSGGNTISGGDVVEGESKNELYIETIIDGETVEKIHKVTEDEPIQYESEITVEGGNVTKEVITETPALNSVAEVSIPEITEPEATTTIENSEISVEEKNEFNFLALIINIFNHVLSIFKT